MEKKKKWIIALIIIILLLLFVILYLLFGNKKSFTITFDTGGGTKISEIEVKDGEIVKLPESPKKEGYTFVAWVNEKGKVVTKGTKVTEDIVLEAVWVDNKVEKVNIEFDTDGGNQIDKLVVEKGKGILLPVTPIKEGYIFIGWINEEGNLITENTILEENIKLKAKWVKENAKTVKVKVDFENGSNDINVVIEKGKIILLPIDPVKDGYVFAGWVDQKGNIVIKDTKVDKNITIKATWKEPYTCPSDCVPIGDGSKCTKTSTTDLIVYTGCPTGTETVETFCSTHKRQVSVGFDEDQTFVDAGILCNGSPSGFCVDYNGRYESSVDSCPATHFKYTYSASGLDAEFGCAKKYEKGGSSCPSGYQKEGNKCIKKETINCMAN